MFKLCTIAVLTCLLTCFAAASQDDYTVVPVDTNKANISLFLDSDLGVRYRTFTNLRNALKAKGHELVFAMNGGMFESDGSPVGLLVIDRKEIKPLNTRDGRGNFYLKPNGVFALTSAGPVVVATSDYNNISRDTIFATQSGPLLLKDGKINPIFDLKSVSKFKRNGVCAIDKVAYFVISNVPVSLYEFARFFKDEIGCQDALYLDGSVSSLYSKDKRPYENSPQVGPIFGVVE
jgi:uncharacterized protein YigE (DUF2233 family)